MQTSKTIKPLTNEQREQWAIATAVQQWAQTRSFAPALVPTDDGNLVLPPTFLRTLPLLVAELTQDDENAADIAWAEADAAQYEIAAALEVLNRHKALLSAQDRAAVKGVIRRKLADVAPLREQWKGSTLGALLAIHYSNEITAPKKPAKKRRKTVPKSRQRKQAMTT